MPSVCAHLACTWVAGSYAGQCTAAATSSPAQAPASGANTYQTVKHPGCISSCSDRPGKVKRPTREPDAQGYHNVCASADSHMRLQSPDSCCQALRLPLSQTPVVVGLAQGAQPLLTPQKTPTCRCPTVVSSPLWAPPGSLDDT
jgi:hypothetical protein